MTYRLELWKHGFLGTAEAHPLRQIQALIRARAANTQERHTMRIQREHDKHVTTEIGAGVLHDVTADEFLVSASVYGIGRDGKPVKFRITMTERELDQLKHARVAFDVGSDTNG